MSLIQAQQLIQKGDLHEAEKLLRSLSSNEKNSQLYQKVTKQFQKKQISLKNTFINNTFKKAKNSDPKTALQLYKDILNIDPNNSKAIKLRQNTYNKIHKQLGHQYKQISQELKQKSIQLIKENQTSEALNIIYTNNIIPEELRESLEIEIKRKIIDQKLKQNKNKLKQTPAPQKFDFLKQLYELEPTYKPIQKSLIRAQKSLQNYSKIQKKNLTKEMLREIKILFNQRKFTKAKQAAQKLISISPDNKTAKKYYNKAKESYYTDSFKKAYKVLQNKT